MIINQQGRSTVQLRNLSSGGRIPLRHLYRHQPHSSPSLSWNGRYLAIITQQGNRRLAVIEDLITGQIHRLPLRAERQPISLKISPDARKIAFELINGSSPCILIYKSNFFFILLAASLILSVPV